ncbi:hypothetical protein GPECTOR_77g11 [Gonium pectorale]|uniref:Uncharacterized protein n=1 Tax=Gonium pectorale TaxID=33097 RepID=A0A150G271_GONPE|nr:hypothetical protein GPECTOR_77g11 [Gonium pectorale]|eukprot:KXZ43914.1 hypothetical protein GPECTOR_77g11 [Gonium pectorale]
MADPVTVVVAVAAFGAMAEYVAWLLSVLRGPDEEPGPASRPAGGSGPSAPSARARLRRARRGCFLHCCRCCASLFDALCHAPGEAHLPPTERL